MNIVQLGANLAFLYLMRPIWSIIVNIGYWAINLGDLPSAVRKKKELKKSIKLIKHIEPIIQKFTWKEDNFKDWVPWIITIINKQYTDDCDGAAKLAHWLLNTLHQRSKIYSLFGPGRSHAVCITKDKKYLFSNNQMIRVYWIQNWKKELLDLFEGYTKVI